MLPFSPPRELRAPNDAAIQDAVEDVGRRVVAVVRADRLEDLVRTARVVEEPDEARQPVEGERRLAEGARVAAVVELVVLAVHVRVEAAVGGLQRAGTAREMRVDQARRQVLRAVAVRVDGREHAAAARPDAVVARLAAHVELDDLERPEAARERLRLELEVEHVVPLREIELFVGVEVVRQRADLLGDVAVQLELAVERRDGAASVPASRAATGRAPRDPAPVAAPLPECDTSPIAHASPPYRLGGGAHMNAPAAQSRIIAASGRIGQWKRACDASRRRPRSRRRRDAGARAALRTCSGSAGRSRRVRGPRRGHARRRLRRRCGRRGSRRPDLVDRRIDHLLAAHEHVGADRRREALGEAVHDGRQDRARLRQHVVDERVVDHQAVLVIAGEGREGAEHVDGPLE